MAVVDRHFRRKGMLQQTCDGGNDNQCYPAGTLDSTQALVAMEPAKFGSNKCKGSRRLGKRAMHSSDGDFIVVVITTRNNQELKKVVGCVKFLK